MHKASLQNNEVAVHQDEPSESELCCGLIMGTGMCLLLLRYKRSHFARFAGRQPRTAA